MGDWQGVRLLGAVRRAKARRRDRSPLEGPHHAQGQRQASTGRRSQSDDRDVPEIISKLSEMVELTPGDIIIDGTPSGVRDRRRRQDRVRGRGCRHVHVRIGQPLEVAASRGPPAALSVWRLLDRGRYLQQAAISAVPRGQHQSDRHRAGGDRQRQRHRARSRNSPCRCCAIPQHCAAIPWSAISAMVCADDRRCVRPSASSRQLAHPSPERAGRARASSPRNPLRPDSAAASIRRLAHWDRCRRRGGGTVTVHQKPRAARCRRARSPRSCRREAARSRASAGHRRLGPRDRSSKGRRKPVRRTSPRAGAPCGNAMRSPRGRRRLDCGIGLARHHRIVLAQSMTVAAIGPTELSVLLSGKAPPVGTRCRLGLKPTRPTAPRGCAPSRRYRYRSRCRTCRRRPRSARPRTNRRGRGAITRIAGRAEMRVGADPRKGEFHHIGLGDDHRAARAQPADHRGVGDGRRSLGQYPGTRARRLARDVEQILDADHKRRRAGPTTFAPTPSVHPPHQPPRVRSGIDREAGARTFAVGSAIRARLVPIDHETSASALLCP